MALLNVLCVGGHLTPYGAPRAQLSLLSDIDRNIILPTVYFLRNDGALPSDLPLLFGVKAGQRARNHTPRLLADLVKLARRSDLIFSMLEGPPLYLSALAARVTGRPMVSWVHNSWSAVLSNSSAYHRPASRIFMPLADHTICVSEGVQRDLLAFCPALHGRCETIPNPIPIDQIVANAAEELPNWAIHIFEKPTVLAVGRLTWQKGFDDLIRASKLALQEGADFNLLIVGEGEDRECLASLAQELGIADRVFLPGFVSNPYPLYKRAAMLTLSSRHEGLPTVLIEALALGLPIVSLDCSFGPREILEAGRWGRLLPEADIAALGLAIVRAIRDPSWISEFRRAGSNRADFYSTRAVITRFEDALQITASAYERARLR